MLAIKFSLHYRVAARRGILAAWRLGATVLRYYSFQGRRNGGALRGQFPLTFERGGNGGTGALT